MTIDPFQPLRDHLDELLTKAIREREERHEVVIDGLTTVIKKQFQTMQGMMESIEGMYDYIPDDRKAQFAKHLDTLADLMKPHGEIVAELTKIMEGKP